MEEIELMLRSAVPIDDRDRFLLGPDDGLAVVWVNITERPDLQVLADRHATEQGYCICTWFFANPGKRNMLVGLRVEMRQPTRTVFHLVFKVAWYIEQLSLLSQTGKFCVVSGPPPASLVGMRAMTAQDFLEQVVAQVGGGVIIELEPRLVEELRNQLEEWKRVMVVSLNSCSSLSTKPAP